MEAADWGHDGVGVFSLPIGTFPIGLMIIIDLLNVFFRCLKLMLTDWQTDRQTDICISRAAFAAEKQLHFFSTDLSWLLNSFWGKLMVKPNPTKVDLPLKLANIFNYKYLQHCFGKKYSKFNCTSFPQFFVGFNIFLRENSGAKPNQTKIKMHLK